MGHETEIATVAVLDRPAQGSIDPQLRIDSGEITEQRVNELAANLDRHYVWVGNELVEVGLIPKWCVDGRGDLEGFELAPNAAGGTYSLVVGDALIDAPALLVNGETSASHGKRLFSGLIANQYEVGGHTDNKANSETCGCGACDKMGTIISFVAEHIAELSEKAAGLGVSIGEELQSKIKDNAVNLINGGYVSTGKDMIQGIKDVAGDSSVQTLKNAHKEVILAVNTVEGTTLDRRSLAEEFGDDYQAFNLDVWALKNGIDAISTSESEADEKFAAAVLYNIATACVLGGPSLRVVVR